MLFYAFLGFQGLAANTQTTGFTNEYGIKGWNDSGIARGTTQINGITTDNVTTSAEVI